MGRCCAAGGKEAAIATKLTRPIYRSRAWQALRAEALRRAGWRCAHCGGYAREVHHKVPVAQGGPEIPGLTGVLVLCKDCHVREHHPQSEERKEFRGFVARLMRTR